MNFASPAVIDAAASGVLRPVAKDGVRDFHGPFDGGGARLKQTLIWFVLAATAATQVAAADLDAAFPPLLKPEAQEARAAHLAAEVLSRFHYKAVPLDNALSAKIFDQYLKALDPEKLYFLQSDIDRLEADRTLLDDAILTEDLRDRKSTRLNSSHI